MPYTLSKSPRLEKWGKIPYQKAFDLQQRYVEEILSGERDETIVFCSHDPVVTLGRGTQQGDVFSWSGETVEVNRGGRATYHGPHQVVMYPLVRLDEEAPKKIKPKDIHGYLRTVENALIQVLTEAYGLRALGHEAQVDRHGGDPKEATGVWFEQKKLASVGIAVKKWVCSHGIAFNVFHDEDAFQGIHPCGFTAETMTSLETVLQKQQRPQELSRSAIEDQLYAAFCRLFWNDGDGARKGESL